MDDFPEITSMECVNALWRLGYAIADANDRRVSMVRTTDGRRVFVERHKTLTAQEVRVILLVADVEASTFLAEIAEHKGAPDASVVQSSGIRARDARDTKRGAR